VPSVGKMDNIATEGERDIGATAKWNQTRGETVRKKLNHGPCKKRGNNEGPDQARQGVGRQHTRSRLKRL